MKQHWILYSITRMNIKQHLIERGFLLDDPFFPVFVDTVENVASFPLYNLTGKLVGFHYYNPIGYKGTGSYKATIRKYETKVTRENDNPKVPQLAVYGLHTLSDDKPYVFVVEGVFDAVKLMRLGYPVIAVLSNDPKPLKNFFFLLQKKIIVIADSNLRGRELTDMRSMSDFLYHVSEKYGDLGNMTLEQVEKFIIETVNL